MVNTSLYTEAQLRELAFTAEESAMLKAMLKAAKEMPITFDEECPATTPEKAIRFRRVNPPRETVQAK